MIAPSRVQPIEAVAVPRVLLIAGAFTSVPRWVNIPLLALDIAIFSLLYKLLRLRYLDAKRERRFAR